MTPEESREAVQAIMRKAATDADFRAKCLADPAAAAREAGVELPPGTIFSESADTPESVVLPRFGGGPDEITDEQLLSNISGGFQHTAVTCWCTKATGPGECAP